MGTVPFFPLRSPRLLPHRISVIILLDGAVEVMFVLFWGVVPLALRVATVHAVAVVLLTCPVVCLSHSAAAMSAPQGRSRAACGCCCRQLPGPNSPNQERPGKPDSRQGNGTCLCHGAVMDRHVVLPDPGQQVLGLVPPDALLLVLEPWTAERGLFTERVSCHFPTADCGRAVRALIASLLL
jgi:hypothetical protein